MKLFFFSILFFTSFCVLGQPGRALLHSQNTTSTPVPADSTKVKINMSLTDKNISTANDFFGHPHLSVITFSDLKDTTGASTGWSINTVATTNWGSYSNLTANDAIGGVTGGTGLGAWANNTAVMGSGMFNYNVVYNESFPQLRITGLNPGKNYTIQITGTDGNFGFDCTQQYRVKGLTSPAMQQVDGNVLAQNNRATFTLKPTGGGVIDIWLNMASGVGSNNLAFVNGLVITETE